MGIAVRYKKNPEEARAMVNAGFLKIFSNLVSYAPPTPFEAWIRRIMINTLIDDFRKNQKEKSIVQQTDFSEANGMDYGFSFNDAEQLLHIQALEAMILALPPMTRNVFNLYAIDGFKHREIADLLLISINTSKWHLAHARKKLVAMLQAELHPTVTHQKKESNAQ